MIAATRSAEGFRDGLIRQVARQLRPVFRRLPPGLQAKLLGLKKREGSTEFSSENGEVAPRSTAANHARRHPTVIVMYHRIDVDPLDPFLLSVEPANFALQLDCLLRLAEPIALRDVLRPSRHPRVAVTFDDGYADNVTNALPLLEAKGVPATVFVTSDMVGTGREFWPDRLERLLLRDGTVGVGAMSTLKVAGETVTLDLDGPQARKKALSDLHPQLRLLEPAEISRLLDELEDGLGAPPEATAPRRPVTEEELQDLAANKWTTVGAHTRSHPWLSALPVGRQRDEIVGSRRRLEEMTGRSVDLFAYPFGYFDSYDWSTVRIVRNAGFALACATHSEATTRLTSRYRLPRKMVLNWGGGEFERHLVPWLEE